MKKERKVRKQGEWSRSDRRFSPAPVGYISRKVGAKQRSCLSCDKMFKSRSIENRICPDCKGSEKYRSLGEHGFGGGPLSRVKW